MYYLFDRHWPNRSEDWKHILDDYILTFDVSRHAMLESWVFFLLDEKDDMALEVCSLHSSTAFEITFCSFAF